MRQSTLIYVQKSVTRRIQIRKWAIVGKRNSSAEEYCEWSTGCCEWWNNVACMHCIPGECLTEVANDELMLRMATEDIANMTALDNAICK